MITELNHGGETFAGVDYTLIATRYDQFSTPYSATFLTAGPGARVDNVLLQDGCPGRHLGSLRDDLLAAGDLRDAARTRCLEAARLHGAPVESGLGIDRVAR